MSTLTEETSILGGSRFLLPTVILASTLTASTQVASAPVTNLQNKFRGKTWQGTLPTEVSVYDESAGSLLMDMVPGSASIVAGDPNTVDLSPYLHTHKIVVVDTNGKTAWGYIGGSTGGDYLVTQSGDYLITQSGDYIVTPTRYWITSKPGETDGGAWAHIEYGFDPNLIATWDVYPVTVNVDCSFGQDRDVDTLVLVNHNLTPEARILVMLGTSAGAEDVGFGWFPGWNPFFSFDDSLAHGCGGFLSTVESDRLEWTGKLRAVYLDSALEASHLRIAMWDPDNTDGYVEAGVLLAGSRLEATYAPDANSGGSTPMDPSVISKSVGRNSWRDELPPYRELSYVYTDTPGGETYLVWYDMLRRQGSGVPFFVDLLPGMTTLNIDQRVNNMLYAEIPQGGISQISSPYMDRGVIQLSVEEAL